MSENDHDPRALESTQLKILEETREKTQFLPREPGVPWPTDYVRVQRLVIYEGERSWVEECLLRAIHGTRQVAPKGRITGITLDPFPVPIENPIQATREAKAEFGKEIATLIEASDEASVQPDSKTLQAIHRLVLHAQLAK